MTDILFLSKGRPEFTRESWAALQKNTPNATFWVFTDGDESQGLTGCEIIEPFGGPVACLNGFLDLLNSLNLRPEYIFKADNDVVCPPGWLGACLDIMRRHPEVDLLGIEPWTPDTKLFPQWVEPFEVYKREPGPNPVLPYWPAEPRIVSHIGGIGVFRRSAFERFGRPTPNTKDGRYGFTEWQWAHKDMVKAFIDPPLPVFLLDHLPSPYFMHLSKKYENEGSQRRVWGWYHPVLHSALWDWWRPAFASGENESGRVGSVGGPQR
jgi:hypothetical protein